MPSTHEELLADYIRAADRDDWFVARQYCNSAGCGPMSEECHREDFSPAQKEMWVKLYEDRDGAKDRRMAGISARALAEIVDQE